MIKICEVKGCESKVIARNACRKHYLRLWKKHASKWKTTLLEKFTERCIPVTETGCWLWLGKIEKKGYGVFRMKTKGIKAHRLAYELLVGPIPKGMYVCHKCDVRSCVNPSHLFLGTQRDNMDDMKRKGRGAHPHGQHVGTSKLTDEMVKEILLSSEPQRKTAKKYGVSKSVIGYIRRREIWKHVKRPCEESLYAKSPLGAGLTNQFGEPWIKDGY